MRLTFATAAAFAALISATPALAAGHSWQVGADSLHLYLNDLDLKSAAGRGQALARVEKGAVRLCRDSSLRSDRAACEADVISAATRGPAGATLRLALSERANQAWAMAQSK
jgi:UrcA family protein